MVEAVYILNNSGIPILSMVQPLKESVSDNQDAESYLFSGILSAIMSIMEEINAGMLKKINTDRRYIHLYRNNDFSIAIITNLDDTLEDSVVEEIFSQIETEIFFFLDKSKENISLISDSEWEVLEKKILSIIRNTYSDQEDQQAIKRIKESLW